MFPHIRDKIKDRAYINIVHIFSGDLWAGAEVIIFNLLSELNKMKEIKLSGICLNKGVLAHKLIKERVDIQLIDEKRHSFFFILLKAIKLIFPIKENIIIHSHRYKENILAFLIKLLIKPDAKLVSTVHGISETEKGLKKIKDYANFWILKNFFVVIAVSYELKNQLIKKGFSENMIMVIHNGIKLPYCSKKKKNKVIHIGTVGRLVKIKRYSLFLDIAYKIKNLRSNTKFSILGDGPLKKRLEYKAVYLGLKNDIKFIGHTSNPHPYYRTLDIYLNTSSHEGLPISLLEAMAHKLPVVAFKVGGIPEIIENYKDGFLIDQDDIKDFINKVLLLIDDPKLREKLGENSRKKVKSRFNAKSMASAYYKLYGKLIR